MLGKNREQHFAAFELYWELELGPRLTNAEMLVRHPDAPKNRNQYLYLLLNAYIQQSIDLALLKIFETAKYFKLKGLPEVEPLVTYRNKFVAHFEANRGTTENQALLQGVKESDWAIFHQLRMGARALISEIRKRRIEITVGLKAPVHPLMDEIDISEIIRRLNERPLPEHSSRQRHVT